MVRKVNEAGTGKPNIVIPTIRSPEFFSNFLDKWSNEFEGCHVIVIEDRETKQLSELMTAKSKDKYTFELYDWKDIDEDLKGDSWIIPRKTDCVRNYGYLMAYRNKPLMIVTLDDDIEPDSQGHISQFYYNLFESKPKSRLDYFSTTLGIRPRGNIKGEPEIKVSHGGWTNVPDLDAHTQLTTQSYGMGREEQYSGVIPKGCYFSMCGMNLAWKPEMTPGMYFPLMGKYNGYEIDRSGDIFCGYAIKKVCDHNDWGIITGKPFCHHTRASNPWQNLIKEDKFYRYQELFLTSLEGKSQKGNTDEVKWCDDMRKAYDIWGKLCESYSSNR
jgi:reversibly glycosylated polypeptide / UDP-arabinopyranose mutase